MHSIPGIRGEVRQGLHTADDERGMEFQGEIVGTGALPGVREGTGEGVTGGAPSNQVRRVQVILAADDDCPEVVRNLYWARAVWKRMTITLSREGA